jgi:hypothetical protein
MALIQIENEEKRMKMELEADEAKEAQLIGSGEGRVRPEPTHDEVWQAKVVSQLRDARREVSGHARAVGAAAAKCRLSQCVQCSKTKADLHCFRAGMVHFLHC